MIGKVQWHSRAVSAALQDPHKNIVFVCGEYRLAKFAFLQAIDELVTKIPDYPRQINHKYMTITMAEGGRIEFRVLARISDCHGIDGRTFHKAIYDESWLWHVSEPTTRSYIRTMVDSRIR